MNVKPASVDLGEPVIRAVLDETPAPGLMPVPILPVKLVDRPRRSEDPRLARGNDNRADRAAELRAEILAEAAELAERRAIARKAGGGSGEPLGETRRSAALPPPPKPARKSDVVYRQAKDRDAREFEQPVDRLELIRRAALALRRRQDASAKARPLPGLPAKSNPVAIPPLPTATRRARLERAIAFLKARCILVSICDRAALVRQYRVTGKREPMLAEDVIELAAWHGMQDEEGAN